MQERTIGFVGRAAVEGVADEGVAEGGHLDTDLVGSAG